MHPKEGHYSYTDLANATGAAERTGITGRECGCPAGEENAMGADPTDTWWPPGKARKRGCPRETGWMGGITPR